MTRWFRFYDESLNDPKVQRLDPKLFKAWVNILCIASKNGGWLPSVDDVAFALRVSETEAGRIVDGLISSELIDEVDGRFRPHNWDDRQYESDSSAERMRRHRDKRKVKGDGGGDVTRYKSDGASDVTVTLQNRTESDTEKKDAEAKASGASAPLDVRAQLFSRGLATLAKITGKGPDACRSFVGKCLKASEDNAITVLGLIEDAERNQAVDPAAWIVARLKPTETGNGKSKIIQAADDLVRKIASFDGPARATDEIRSAEGKVVTRLLSHG